MAQTIQLSQTRFDELFKRLSRLEAMMAKLLEKIDEPQYGSDEWWKWADKKGLEAVKKGNYVTLSTKEELQSYVDSLK